MKNKVHLANLVRFSKTPLPHQKAWRLSALLAMPILLASCAGTPSAKTAQHSSAKSPTKSSKPTIALVLGGGGAKGFAHIGVIGELEKNGISPDMIVGTSAGAMIGAIYAGGSTPSQLQAFANAFDEKSLIDLSPSHQGLIEGNYLRQLINRQVQNRTVKELPKRFVAVATDLKTGQAVALTTGDTGLIVQASSSIPKLFIPPRINDKGQMDRYGNRYVDGGQSALVPAQIAKNMGADIVISVDVMSDNTPVAFEMSDFESANGEPLSIKRDKGGFSASFGGFSLNIPVNFDDLPIKIDDSKIPSEFSLNIPKKALDIIGNPTSIFANLSTAKMSEQDKQASDIVIRPKLQTISVIDTQKRQTAIIAGQVATAQEIGKIKGLIDEKGKK